MANLYKEKMSEKLLCQNEEDLNASSPDISNEGLNGNETDSACEEDILDDELLGEEPESIIPQQVLDLADHALARLPPRWRNWITRVISGLSLISGFSFLISLGPIGLFFLTFLVEFSSYNEFLKLGQRICGVREKFMSKWCRCYFLCLIGSSCLQWDLKLVKILRVYPYWKKS